jgi:hypothetical protein
MRASEILRGLADLIDSAEGGAAAQEMPNKAELAPVEVDNKDDSEVSVFVPPLQAKMEILKKSVGMDNVYDGEGDELGDVKKLAGISPVQQEAGDEDPLDA